MFNIDFGDGRLVAGFSEEHQIVFTAGDPAFVQNFATEVEAKEFVDKYVDAGYGLTSKCRVVPAK